MSLAAAAQERPTKGKGARTSPRPSALATHTPSTPGHPRGQASRREGEMNEEGGDRRGRGHLRRPGRAQGGGSSPPRRRQSGTGRAVPAGTHAGVLPGVADHHAKHGGSGRRRRSCSLPGSGSRPPPQPPRPNVTRGPRRGRCPPPQPGCSSSGVCLFALRRGAPGPAAPPPRPAPAPQSAPGFAPPAFARPPSARPAAPLGGTGTCPGTPGPLAEGGKQAPTPPGPARC